MLPPDAIDLALGANNTVRLRQISHYMPIKLASGAKIAASARHMLLNGAIVGVECQIKLAVGAIMFAAK